MLQLVVNASKHIANLYLYLSCWSAVLYFSLVNLMISHDLYEICQYEIMLAFLLSPLCQIFFDSQGKKIKRGSLSPSLSLLF